MDEGMEYWRELRRRLERDQDARAQLEAQIAEMARRQGLSRRARECWTEQDDYLFNAGYLAWEATGER